MANMGSRRRREKDSLSDQTDNPFLDVVLASSRIALAPGTKRRCQYRASRSGCVADSVPAVGHKNLEAAYGMSLPDIAQHARRLASRTPMSAA
eukprot:663915-Rhodomonas_salina.1